MDHSNNDDALSPDFTLMMRGCASPDFAPREPSSDYLRQKLRERRLGVDDRPLRSLSLGNHKPVATMDDYIFANEDLTKKDRRRSRASALRRSSLQPNGSVAQNNSNPAMASKEAQSAMDKLSNENFDLKLRLRLMEQKNHRLEEQVEHEQEKTERLAEVAAQRDDLDDENADLCARVEELQESVLNTEQKLLDSWKMNSEVIRELEKRDADIKEALDMYLDAETRLQALEQKYAACKLRRDSSYFSNDADAVSISKPVDGPNTPKRAPSKPPSADSPLPRKQRSASTPIRNGQLNGRYHKLVRTISVSEIRTNELRRQASVVAIAENEEPQPASTPERRPRGLRRFSATPQYDQMSVSSYKTTSSERSRGLRMKFLEGEQNGDTDSSPSTKPWSASVSPHSRTPRHTKDSSRQIPTPSSWSTSHSRAHEDADSVASSELPVPSEMSAEDDTTIIHEEPQPEDDVATPTLTIPTEYYPGHYPKWPGTPSKYFRASNMFFDGDGVEELPRIRQR